MRRWPTWLAPVLLSAALAACGWVEVESDSPPPQRAVQANAPRVAVENGQRVVQVRSGDTMFGLANQLDVTRRQMIVLNDLAPPFTLRSGQKLRLPAEQTLHRVQSGETLSQIAETYGVDLKRLAAHNLIVPPYDIRSNQLIGVPRDGRRIVASRPPTQSGGIETEPLAPPPQPQPRVAERAQPSQQSTVVAPATKPPAAPTIATAPPAERSQPVAAAPEPPAEAAPQASTQPATRPDPNPQAAAPIRRGGPGAATPGKSDGFLVPVEGPVIAGFGSQADGRRNDGVNIAAPKGAPVRSAADGEVVYAGDALQGYGNLVLVKHSDNWVTAYAHLDRILAKRGDRVQRGQTIGAVGSTGGVPTSQLHFEMRRNNKAVDPKGRLAAK